MQSSDNMTNKKIPHSMIKVVERVKADIPNTQIHDRSLPCLVKPNTQIHDRSLPCLVTPNTQIHDRSLPCLVTPNTQIHDRSLPCLVKRTSIQSN